jgi:hypothetical protein
MLVACLAAAAAAPVRVATKVGRTLLSSHPHAAAAFYVRRFGARVIERAEDAHFGGGLLSSPDASCSTVVTVELPSTWHYQRIQFVRDQRKPTLTHGSPYVMTQRVQQDLSNSTDIDLAAPWAAYSAWTDNHDGAPLLHASRQPLTPALSLRLRPPTLEATTSSVTLSVPR